jgi:lipopolysaccharide/colanic/teichoic acid biosynthesis glycosyltransferase
MSPEPGQWEIMSNSQAVRARRNGAVARPPVEHFVPDSRADGSNNTPPRIAAVPNSQPSNSTFAADESTNTQRFPRAKTRGSIVFDSGKRAFDLLAGSALLVVATPIILVAAAAIRIESKCSPFFIQTRVGKNGRPFKIVKLRGMFKDARVRFPSYYDYSSKPDLDFCFHHETDPRVTRAGKFIRKTSIDELPNLWNVVLGDISLVGPRPEIPEVMALYGPYQEEYLSVKPGVTCLSKCTGRDRLTKRETIEYDLNYIRRRGFKLDVKILWQTFRGVILRRDVY